MGDNVNSLRNNPKTSILGGALAAAVAVVQVPGLIPPDWQAATNGIIAAIASVALALYANDPVVS